MSIKDTIYKLRTKAKMSQEQFATLFQVSRQSVQKWESGTSVPELSKIIEISKYFDISLDAMILNRDNRVTEELKYNKEMKPQYSSSYQHHRHHRRELYPETGRASLNSALSTQGFENRGVLKLR